ncbi:MAG: carboxymuconolactone decarboxylase family protein [Colwellia sp.]|nr:carboxymuconolactone decarboxylase family protein [Colwellia sp.]
MTSYRRTEFRAFFAYHDAIIHLEGSTNPAEKEMFFGATSVPNTCQYCVVAHGAMVMRIS